MTDHDAIARHVDAAAALAGLTIPPANREAVIAYFRLTASLAVQIEAFALPPEIEPAPTWLPEPRETDR
jgi:hypothetical protein